MAETGRLEELQRKFEENPRRFFAPLANEYRKGGSIERAIELCREYLPTQPGHMSGYIVYGQALFDGGQHAEAGEAFQQALAIDPENIIALRRLGDIARYAGQRDVAERWYRRVLEIDPKNEEATAYLARLSTEERGEETAAATPAPQIVRQEPVPEADTVTLSELVEQPDVPFPDVSFVEPVEAPRSDPFEAFASLPLITEFMMSARVVETIEPPVDGPPAELASAPDHSAFDWEAAEPFPAEPEVTSNPVLFEFAAMETVEVPVPEPPISMEPPAEPANSLPVQNESYEPPATPSEPATVPFVTETMADLYMQQGFTAQALDVYRRLAVTNADPQLIEKMQHLERVMMEQSQAASASAPFMTVRDFFARIGACRPDMQASATTPAAAAAEHPPAHGLSALFGSASVDENDARAASALADAYPATH